MEFNFSNFQRTSLQIDIIVDSDSRVFLALQGDGAHRLCAAKMRGDREILCRGISVVRLK